MSFSSTSDQTKESHKTPLRCYCNSSQENEERMCDCPERFHILCSFTSVSLSELFMWLVPREDPVYYYLFYFFSKRFLKLLLSPSRNSAYCIHCPSFCPFFFNLSPLFFFYKCYYLKQTILSYVYASF